MEASQRNCDDSQNYWLYECATFQTSTKGMFVYWSAITVQGYQIIEE